MSRAILRGGLAAASLALCLAGMASLTQGVAVPVKAAVAQHSLERVFEQRLVANPKTEITRFRRSPEGSHPSRNAGNARKQAAMPFPDEGPIARLSVDRLGVSDIVLAGDPTHDRLALGPTMLKRGDAANPVTVLAAHRDTHFLFIRDLRPGDEVTLQLVDGDIGHYRVTRLETVRWDQFRYPRDPARPLLALATCYPFGGTEYGGPLRRVAWAERINPGAPVNGDAAIAKIGSQ